MSAEEILFTKIDTSKNTGLNFTFQTFGATPPRIPSFRRPQKTNLRCWMGINIFSFNVLIQPNGFPPWKVFLSRSLEVFVCTIVVPIYKSNPQHANLWYLEDSSAQNNGPLFLKKVKCFLRRGAAKEGYWISILSYRDEILPMTAKPHYEPSYQCISTCTLWNIAKSSRLTLGRDLFITLLGSSRLYYSSTAKKREQIPWQ